VIPGPCSPLAWEVLERPLEVVPMNDIRPHITGMTCWCRPEVDENHTTVHNALDRRDQYMDGTRRPS
jgi:hypothetical protein